MSRIFAMEPVRFERAKERTRKGCFITALLAPVLTFILWIPLSALITWILPKMGAGLPTASDVSVIYLLIIFVVVSWSLWKDYANHGAAVTVSDDRIQLDLPRDHATVMIEAIDSIRLESYRYGLKVIVRSKEHSHALPTDFATFSLVQEAFEARVLPILQQRIEEKVQGGGECVVDESAAASLGRILWALLLIPVSLAGILSIALLSPGFATLIGIPGRIRRGIRGLGGGLQIRSGGVSRRSGVVHKTIGWEELSVAVHDDDGLSLKSRRNGMLSISAEAEGYWAASRWLVAHLSQPPAPENP